MSNPDVLIVGAGLAGLCCARKLHKEGVSFQIIEASDACGGRLRTDRVDGFLLDRGLHVLLTAYPEALAELDYDALELCAFSPGALVRHEGRFYRVSDPWREPGTFLTNFFSPIGRFSDKFRIARLRTALLNASIEEILEAEESSAMSALRRRRFSRRIIDRFFRPLFGGAMLDTRLTTSSRQFEFIFRMLAEGDAALPARGIQAIPEQLAASLPAEAILLDQRVHSVQPGQAKLMTGETISARAVVLATEGPEAVRMLGLERPVASRGVCCLYFSARESPVDEPMPVLSGGSRGPINSLVVVNQVAPGYAPPGENLICITVVGWPSRDDQTLINMVRGQLKRWYGLVAQEWRLLRIYRIDHGLPVSFPLEHQQNPRLQPGLYACGDHRSVPCIHGAMESGRLAAESLLREMRNQPDPPPRKRSSAGKHHQHHNRPAPEPGSDDDFD